MLSLASTAIMQDVAVCWNLETIYDFNSVLGLSRKYIYQLLFLVQVKYLVLDICFVVFKMKNIQL